MSITLRVYLTSCVVCRLLQAGIKTILELEKKSQSVICQTIQHNKYSYLFTIYLFLLQIVAEWQ